MKVSTHSSVLISGLYTEMIWSQQSWLYYFSNNSCQEWNQLSESGEKRGHAPECLSGNMGSLCNNMLYVGYSLSPPAQP